MNIRRATIDDLEAILAIELENFSPEEAIDKTVLAKHIETFNTTRTGRIGCIAQRG